MKVIILVAGQGSRLKPLTDNLPKCLLEIKPGITILDQILLNLKQVNVGGTIIVTGFCAEKVKQHLVHTNITTGMRAITIINNSEYETTNAIYSLYLAKDLLDGEDFVLINGDTICDPLLLKEIMCDQAHKNYALVDTSKANLDNDSSKVRLNGEEIIDIGKDIPLDKADGDAIGIYKFDKGGSTKVFKHLKKLFKNPECRKLHYQRPFLQAVKMFALFTADRYWDEIDTPADLERVRARFKQ